jgi:hypothetical protein
MLSVVLRTSRKAAVPPPTQSTRTTAIEISVIGRALDFLGGGVGWP